jgi:outer membrane protein assembly factor BamE (lipoprotein component of BamABCDE complex)
MKPVLLTMVMACVSLLIAGCDPIVDARGYNTNESDFKQIVIGQSRMEDVVAILGSPSARSTFGDETWYYIQARKETRGLLAPEIAEQNVAAIRFDANQVVAAIESHTKADAVPVEMVEKTTPTEGRKLGVMEQLLGNVGRFSAPGRGMSDRNMGR